MVMLMTKICLKSSRFLHAGLFKVGMYPVCKQWRSNRAFGGMAVLQLGQSGAAGVNILTTFATRGVVIYDRGSVLVATQA